MTPGKLNLLTALVFISVMIAVLAVAHWRRERRLEQQRAQRIAQILGTDTQQSVDEVDSILKARSSSPLYNLPLLGSGLQNLSQQLAFIGWQKTLRKRLLILSALGLLGGITLGQRTPHPLAFGLLFSLLLTLSLALLLFRSALQKQLKELRESLPDAIDAITRSVRAGVPVANTFGQVAAHLSGPLATEFRTLDHWLKLGIPLRQAIHTSAGRVPMAEYRFFAVILIINQEAGGRLGETLERLAITLRQRRELALKVQSKTSEARASAKIVAALFPCCLGYTWLKSPEDIDFLFSDPVGSSILIYALCSIALGMIITHLMVKRVA